MYLAVMPSRVPLGLGRFSVPKRVASSRLNSGSHSNKRPFSVDILSMSSIPVRPSSPSVLSPSSQSARDIMPSSGSKMFDPD